MAGKITGQELAYHTLSTLGITDVATSAGRVTVSSVDGSNNVWLGTGSTEPNSLSYGWKTDGAGVITQILLGNSTNHPSVITGNNTLDDGVGNIIFPNGKSISTTAGASIFTGSAGTAWGIKAGSSTSNALLVQNSAGNNLLSIGVGANWNQVATLNNTLDDGSGNITLAGNISFPATKGLVTANGASLATGSGGYTWTAKAPTTTVAGFIVQNSAGTNILQVGYYNANQNGVATLNNVLDDGNGLISAVKYGINGKTTAGRYGVPVTVADVSNSQITTTSATTVLTFTPSTEGNFIVNVHLRDITASTTITLTVTYYDAGGTQQTSTILSSTSEAVGTYSAVPLYLNAGTGGAITVNVTAGTVNQVYASATIFAI